MAARTEIRLGRQRFSSRDLQLAVTVTAIAELTWWPAGSEVLGPCASAERVAQLVRAGRLWVGCRGSAFGLVVYPTLQRQDILLRGNAAGKGGSSSSRAASVAGWLAEAILSWPAWDSLGLAVRLEGSEEDGAGRWQSGDRRWDAGRLFFSVAHPSSPDGLCAPAGVPQAQFRRVVCRLNFCLNPDGMRVGVPLTANPDAKGGGSAKVAPRNAGAKKHGKAKPQAQTQTQTAIDRSGKRKPTTKARLASGKRRGKVKQAKAPASAMFSDYALRLKAFTLIEASLYVLVGVKHRVLGVQTMEPIPARPLPSLISIAPAVWNYRHFQVCYKDVSTRAVFVPSICQLLMDCCANAQTPGLRRKAEAVFADTESGEPRERKLESKLHEILLKCVSTLPKKKRGSLKRGPKVAAVDNQTEKQFDISGRGMHVSHIHEQSCGPGQPARKIEPASTAERESDAEGVLWPRNESDACWVEIVDWPEDEDNWQESYGSYEAESEVANYYEHQDVNMDKCVCELDWQEIQDWQLEEWEDNRAGEMHEFRKGSSQYTDENMESETEYVEIDVDDVYMWQDGHGLNAEW